MTLSAPPQPPPSRASVQPESRADALTRSWNNWWASRSAHMVLLAIILFLLAIAIKYFYGGAQVLGSRVLNPITDAALVLCATVVLTEMGPFRTYVEERLEGLRTLLDVPVLDRLADAVYLRENFKLPFREKLRKASTLASLANPKAYPDFLRAMEDFVIPLAGKRVWRKHFELRLRHEIDQRGGQTLLLLSSKSSWTYYNIGDIEEEVTIPIAREYPRLDGVPNYQLCSNGWYRTWMEGSTDTPQTHQLEFRCETGPNSDSVVFKTEFVVKVGKVPVKVETGYDAIEEPNGLFRLSVSAPTAGLRIEYTHPPQISPTPCWFNVGGELVTFESPQGHVWEHSGYFLPNHGIVLAHPLVRRKGERVSGTKGRSVGKSSTGHSTNAA